MSKQKKTVLLPAQLHKGIISINSFYQKAHINSGVDYIVENGLHDSPIRCGKRGEKLANPTRREREMSGREEITHACRCVKTRPKEL
jgi:hypothetical protein